MTRLVRMARLLVAFYLLSRHEMTDANAHLWLPWLRIIDVCVSNRHLVSCTILLGHATTGQPRGAGATATARD